MRSPHTYSPGARVRRVCDSSRYGDRLYHRILQVNAYETLGKVRRSVPTPDKQRFLRIINGILIGSHIERDALQDPCGKFWFDFPRYGLRRGGRHKSPFESGLKMLLRRSPVETADDTANRTGVSLGSPHAWSCRPDVFASQKYRDFLRLDHSFRGTIPNSENTVLAGDPERSVGSGKHSPDGSAF